MENFAQRERERERERLNFKSIIFITTHRERDVRKMPRTFLIVQVCCDRDDICMHLIHKLNDKLKDFFMFTLH